MSEVAVNPEERTARSCWRGLWLDHPADWEVARASALHEPGRLVFSDRRYHRLDVKWQQLTRKPNVYKMLEKHRRRTERQTKTRVVDLTGLPPEWHGVVRDTPDGQIAHAARFFKPVRWIVETVLVWPDGRDAELEYEILDSITADDPEAKLRRWQVSGLSVELERAYDLYASTAQVGRLHWEFRKQPKRGPELTVERLAMPEHWLKDAVRDWLREEQTEDYRTQREGIVNVNGHRAHEMLSWAKVTPINSLRGYKRARYERAWLCDREQRVYRVAMTEERKDVEIEPPQSLRVKCCRDVPAVVASAT